MSAAIQPDRLKTREERELFGRTYVAALQGLLTAGDGGLAEKPGLTRLCREAAWDAVHSFRQAIAGEQPPSRDPLPPPRRP